MRPTACLNVSMLINKPSPRGKTNKMDMNTRRVFTNLQNIKAIPKITIFTWYINQVFNTNYFINVPGGERDGETDYVFAQTLSSVNHSLNTALNLEFNYVDNGGNKYVNVAEACLTSCRLCSFLSWAISRFLFASTILLLCCSSFICFISVTCEQQRGQAS